MRNATAAMKKEQGKEGGRLTGEVHGSVA